MYPGAVELLAVEPVVVVVVVVEEEEEEEEEWQEAGRLEEGGASTIRSPGLLWLVL
jgi:hypothetical protein